MEQYPENLFKATAANILQKHNGGKETHSLAKIAADYSSPRQAEREAFLNRYDLTPDSFKGDKEAERAIQESRSRMENQVRDFYGQQRESGLLDPAASREAENKMIQDIRNRSKGAEERMSIDRTRMIEKKNPAQFRDFHNLSQESEQALGKSHGREVGATLGAIGGGALGLLGGKRLPKNTRGIAQQALGAIGGGAIGGLTGGAIGSNRDEKRTGFNHEDVMKPYEIATRITNQQNFR